MGGIASYVEIVGLLFAPRSTAESGNLTWNQADHRNVAIGTFGQTTALPFCIEPEE